MIIIQISIVITMVSMVFTAVSWKREAEAGGTCASITISASYILLGYR